MNMRGIFGFTLIELLVVISIISLLASIILSSLSSTKLKTQNAADNEVAHQYHIALELYYGSWGYYPDPGLNSPYCLGNNPDPSCTMGHISGALNNALKTYYPAMPYNPIVQGSIPGIGPKYFCNTGSGTGKCTSANLGWFLSGLNSSNNCVDGVSPQPDETTGNTLCVLSLP